MQNFTLASNLQNSAAQPDALAPKQPLTDAQVMSHPFQNMQIGEELLQQMQAPTLSQVQNPMGIPQPDLTRMDFSQLAKQYGIDTKGLNQNAEIGGLQLLKRMQNALGTNFQSHKAFEPLMKAWQAQAKTGSSPELTASATKAERTLGAIMGM